MTRPLSRQLEAAMRRHADAQSQRIADRPTGRVIATVTAVAPLTVSWRGGQYAVNGKATSYTPAVGHRVVCDYIDNQLIVAYNIGAP